MIEPADDQLREVIELARELPADVPSAAHREQVRTALLAHAGSPTAALPRSRRRIAFAGVAAIIAAAAVLAAWIAVRPGSPAVVARRGHGSVRAGASAQFTHATPAPDETVVLHDGTIDVEVERLAPGERFRVLVGGSEIEVRGTAFTVTADHDSLRVVAVTHGRVEVRPSGGATAVLEAGQAWHPLLATTEPASVPVAAPGPTSRDVGGEAITSQANPKRREPVTAAASPPSPPSPSPPAPLRRAPAEISYDEAWDALRAGRFHDASIAFARGLALAPDGSLADDARFWRAVALAREARAPATPEALAALAAFRELVDEHPSNAHHGEASAMLGWLLVDAKLLPEAARRFHAAAEDSNEKVRASARAGLAALNLPPPTASP